MIHQGVELRVVEVEVVNIAGRLDRAAVEVHVDEVERVEVVGAPARVGDVVVRALRLERPVVVRRVRLLEVRLQPDASELGLLELGLARARCTGGVVVDVERRSTVQSAPADLLRLREVREVAVHLELLVSAQTLDQDLVGGVPGVRAELRDDRLTADRVVQRLADVRVVGRRLGVVERLPDDAGLPADVELALVGPAVLRRDRLDVGRRHAGHVPVDLVLLDLEQRSLAIRVREAVDHDLVRVRQAGTVVELVPLQHRQAPGLVRRDVVRTGRRVLEDAARALRVLHARLHGTEPLHAENRDEGRVRLGQAEGDREPLRLDARDVSSVPVGELLRTDDHLVQLVEDAVLRVHLRAQDALPSTLVRRSRDRRAVTEPQAAAKVECDRLAVLRERRERLGGLREQLRAGLARLVREVHEQQLGRVEHLPVVRDVGETRVERVERAGRLVHPQRAAAKCLGGACLLRRRGGNPHSRRRDQQRNSHAQQQQGEHVLPAHMTPSIAPHALTRGPFEVSERHQRLVETPPRRQS